MYKKERINNQKKKNLKKKFPVREIQTVKGNNKIKVYLVNIDNNRVHDV